MKIFHTDAFILQCFASDVRAIDNLKSIEGAQALVKTGQKHLAALLERGFSHADAFDLLNAVLTDITKGQA